MGANISTPPTGDIAISHRRSVKSEPAAVHEQFITNNNGTAGIKMAPPHNISLKRDTIRVEESYHMAFEKEKDFVLNDNHAKVEWNSQVPLMNPAVVEMLVEKMRMMKMMKKEMGKMGAESKMAKGGRGKLDLGPQTMPGVPGTGPNGTMIDGKMQSNGPTLAGNHGKARMFPNGQRHLPGSLAPNGRAPPNGLHPPNGTKPGMGMAMPKVMGCAENVVQVVRHMKAVFNSAEIQELCDEKMDPSQRNIMFKMMQCKLAMEFKVLSDIGMLHLAPLIATGQLPPLIQLIFICYQDEPDVMKEMTFVGPLLSQRPDLVVRRGDVVPEIALRTCSEEAVQLSDLHVNKEVPLVIFAASSS